MSVQPIAPIAPSLIEARMPEVHPDSPPSRPCFRPPLLPSLRLLNQDVVGAACIPMQDARLVDPPQALHDPLLLLRGEPRRNLIRPWVLHRPRLAPPPAQLSEGEPRVEGGGEVGDLVPPR